VRSDGSWFTNSAVAGDFDQSWPAIGYRGLFSFDIGSIPNAAIIQSATLRVFQFGSLGNWPTTHGPAIVSHVDYGGSLDAGDYNGTNISYNIGTISSSTAAGWRELEVKSAVIAANGALPRAQFRVELANLDSNNDGQGQTANFYTASDTGGTGRRPELVVTYTLP